MDSILINRNCFICGSSVRTQIFELSHPNSNVLQLLDMNSDVKNQKSHVYKCNQCGHHYLSPIIRSELMDKYYRAASEYYKKEACPQDHLLKEHKIIVNKIRAIRKNARVLEVGCGYGFLLKILNEHGYNTFGIEPSSHAYEYARNVLELDVTNVLLEDAAYPDEYFDIVILLDVLEHIENVNLFLGAVKKYLKKEGHLLIETGDIESFNARLSKGSWDYFSSWEHISFFSGKSIKHLLLQNGFYHAAVQRVSYRGSFFLNAKIICVKIIKIILMKLFKKEYSLGALAFDHMLVIAKKR